MGSWSSGLPFNERIKISNLSFQKCNKLNRAEILYHQITITFIIIFIKYYIIKRSCKKNNCKNTFLHAYS